MNRNLNLFAGLLLLLAGCATGINPNHGRTQEFADRIASAVELSSALPADQRNEFALQKRRLDDYRIPYIDWLNVYSHGDATLTELRSFEWDYDFEIRKLERMVKP